jgi:hypothetical protein
MLTKLAQAGQKTLSVTIPENYATCTRTDESSRIQEIMVLQKSLETNLHIVLGLRSKRRRERDFRDKSGLRFP